MLRSLLAVVVGLALTIVLVFGGEVAAVWLVPGGFDPATGRLSTRVLLFMLGWVLAAAAAGGWVAARLGRARPVSHALAVGALLLLGEVAISAAFWETLPVWYHALALLPPLPGAWLGGTRAAA